MNFRILGLFALSFFTPVDRDSIARERDFSTDEGGILLNVDRIESSERDQSTAADVQVGYSFTIETDDLIPKLLLLRPFMINRARFQDQTRDFNEAMGVGLRFSIQNKWRSSMIWFAEVRAVHGTSRVSHNDHETELEAHLGVSIPFDQDHEKRRELQRLRGLQQRSAPMQITIASLSEPTSGSIEADHVWLMSLYFAWLVEQKFSDFPDLRLDETRPTYSYLKHIIEQLKERSVYPSEDQILRSKKYTIELQNLLDDTIIAWIRSSLSLGRGLAVVTETTNRISMKSIREYSDNSPGFLNAGLMIQDFRTALMDSLIDESRR